MGRRVSLLQKKLPCADTFRKLTGRQNGLPSLFQIPNDKETQQIRQIWFCAYSQKGSTPANISRLQTLLPIKAGMSFRKFHATGINLGRDYYEILGLKRGVSASEIKKAYYGLAKLHHPDMNKGDTEAEKRFQEIQKAYEILKDDEKRAIYDQVGADAYEQAGSGASGPGFDGSGFGFPFSDIWSEFMKDSYDPDTSEDMQVTLQLSFMESVKGCKKKIQFNTAVRCNTCTGTGFPPGSKPQVCRACKGRGRTSFSKGIFSVETSCSKCGGEGHIVKDTCRTCNGMGTVQKLKELDVDFPPGVKQGDVIKLTGEGGAAPRGHAPGDLFVNLQVLPDPVFKRKGSDIHVDSVISFTQAILGGTVQVPTLTGHAVLKVRPGTQPGQKLCLPGKGIKVPHKGPGDQLVNIHVEMPTPSAMTRMQRIIIEELAKAEAETEAENTAAAAAAGTG